MKTPLAVDLYCGLGGWTDGLIAAGWDVYGFDITRHEYGDSRYPAQLILQDALTIHGSQFRNADLIVASPPCQAYSYLAMPWSRSTDPNNSQAAKALRKKWETEGPDNRLFDACFRIQREAIEARMVRCVNCIRSGEACADCYIPLIVENVRGAVPWVGPAKAKFGSFYLWGDVAQVGDRVYAGSDLKSMRFGGGVAPEANLQKREGRNFHTYALTGGAVSSPSYHGGDHETRGVGMGVKVPTDGTGRRTDVGKGARFTTRDCGVEANSQAMPDGTKIGGDWFRDPACHSKHGSKSNARKAASAMIAKIPLPLSRYIGQVHKQ